MKTFLSLLMTAALTSMAFAAKEDWRDDLEKAKAQAKAENKKIPLDFTGSDWCGWCKKLDKEVFSQQAWKDYAAKHLVLVWTDRRLNYADRTEKRTTDNADFTDGGRKDGLHRALCVICGHHSLCHRR